MSFFSEEEKKKFTSQFFKWEDGKKYHMTVDKRIDTNFANGKEILVIITTDQDTGEVTEHKYLFGLMNALSDLGDAYKDNSTVLDITAHWNRGKLKPNKPGEYYDAWTFDVMVNDAIQDLVDKSEVAKADAALADIK